MVVGLVHFSQTLGRQNTVQDGGPVFFTILLLQGQLELKEKVSC